MRYLIASDLHGSAYYVEKLMDVFNNGRFDKLILLGDILYHGPRNNLPLEYNPKKVIELLNSISNKIICVKGNCDSEVDQMVLDFMIHDKLKIEIDNLKIYLEHGHHLEKYEEDSYVLFGHTHIKKCEVVDNVTYLNPGSVSIPKDKTHSYMIYDDGFKWFNLETKEEIFL